MKLSTKNRKKFRVRNKLKKVSSPSRYRLTIFRSLNNISAQIIDDKLSKTLVSATSNTKSIRDQKKKKSELSEFIAVKIMEELKFLLKLLEKMEWNFKWIKAWNLQKS